MPVLILFPFKRCPSHESAKTAPLRLWVYFHQQRPESEGKKLEIGQNLCKKRKSQEIAHFRDATFLKADLCGEIQRNAVNFHSTLVER